MENFGVLQVYSFGNCTIFDVMCFFHRINRDTIVLDGVELSSGSEGNILGYIEYNNKKNSISLIGRA